jgi:dipeptidyl aminopeptidase/acylaminoacyl peptidase
MNLLTLPDTFALLAAHALLALAGVAAAYVAVCTVVAQRFTRARRQQPATWLDAAEPVRLAARDGRAQIMGWYLDPGDARGAVLFVHGKDGCRGDELKSPSAPLACSLAAAGFAVLTIDLRGHGTSSRARLTYGARERHDVLGAVDWLRARGHGRVGVLGASMGASTALLAAADEPAIAALVSDSAFADFAEMIERQFRRLSRLPGCFLPGALAVGRLLTGVDLRGVSPLASAAALVGRPVLVIHSEGDRFVPVADARAIAKAIGADLWTTATQRHIGSYGGGPEAYTARVLAFFVQHLGQPAAT